MKATPRIALASLLIVGGLMMTFSLGCKSDEQEANLLAPPPGKYIRQWQERQTAKADEEAFIVYLYEWEDGTMLGPAGRRHMHEIVRNVPYWPFPIVIEADLDNPQLNADRRDAMIAYLYDQGVPSPEERVVVQEVLRVQTRATNLTR